LNTILKCYFFFTYFCSICIFLDVYLFYSFFLSNKLVVWIYDLYMLWFVLDFVKLYLFINCWNLCRITDLSVLWWNK
jgi:hypothetical protein